MDPFSAGGAVVGAGMRYAQARAQNAAVRGAMGQVVASSQEEQRQLALKAAIDRKKIVDQARRVVGALRVAGGESGGVAGSYAQLIQQAEIDAQANRAIADQNFAFQSERVRTGTAAQLAQLRSKQKNTLLATVGGAIEGASTGSKIGGLFPSGSTSLPGNPLLNDIAGPSVPVIT